MKIQLAIDRVSIEEAVEIITETKDYIDIIEVGTSLIKDFGLESIRQIKKSFPDKQILADMKVIDEVEYEFRAAYEAGADIVTIMGASALISVEKGQKVAQEYNRKYLIDLLEINEEKLKRLLIFEDGIFGIHLPADKKGDGLTSLLNDNLRFLGDNRCIAVAGGVTIEDIPRLKAGKVEIAIIGGAISKAEDKAAVAKSFKEAAED